jgi:hypothetical protein
LTLGWLSTSSEEAVAGVRLDLFDSTMSKFVLTILNRILFEKLAFTQLIPSLLWNLNFYFRDHKSQIFDPILSKKKKVLPLILPFLRPDLISSSRYV